MNAAHSSLLHNYKQIAESPWKSLLILSTVVGLLLCVSVVLSTQRLLSVVAFVAFVGYLLGIAILLPQFCVKYLAFFFSIGITTLGIFACEFFSLRLVEIDSQTKYVGSLPLLMVGQWSFVSALLLFERLLIVRASQEVKGLPEIKEKYTHSLVNALTVAVAALFSAAFFSIIDKPAFLIGVDRFGYAASITDGTLIEKITPILPSLLVIPCICFSKGNRILSSYTLLIYCLYSVWTGQKFGAIFTALCFFFLANYRLFSDLITRYRIRFLAVLGAVLIAMVGFAATYMIVAAGSSIDYLLIRTSQQGQLWWKTYQITDGEMHASEFSNEIVAALDGEEDISDSVGANNGIYKIMYLCAPEQLVNNKLMSGSRYTDAGYACAYYYFGSIGVVGYGLIMASIVGLLTNVVIYAADHTRILMLILFGRLYNISRTSYLMFTFGDYFDTASKLTYLILLVRVALIHVIKSSSYMSFLVNKYFEKEKD